MSAGRPQHRRPWRGAGPRPLLPEPAPSLWRLEQPSPGGPADDPTAGPALPALEAHDGAAGGGGRPAGSPPPAGGAGPPPPPPRGGPEARGGGDRRPPGG